MLFRSVVATLLILFILVQLERIEKRVSLGSESRIIRLKVGAIVVDMEPYRKALARHNVHLSNLYVEYDYEKGVSHLNLIVLVRENTDYIKLCETLRPLNPTQTITLANQVSF